MAGLRQGVQKINDTLYLLYSPAEGIAAEGIAPDVDVIFFHGLQLGDYRTAYYDTWCNAKNECWPQTLLGEKTFRNARIFSVSYDSSASKKDECGYGDVYNIAENLIVDIIDNEVAKVGRQSPIILVGHSLGGLVIKQLLLMTCETKCSLDNNDPQDRLKIERYDHFIRQVRGIFYYATPHHGSIWADRATWMPDSKKSDVLTFLKTLSNVTSRLNEKLRKFRNKHGIDAVTLAEGLPTPRFKLGDKLVVSEGSSRSDSRQHYTSRYNHTDVCKAEEMTDSRFSLLSDFIAKKTQARQVEKTQASQVVEEDDIC